MRTRVYAGWRGRGQPAVVLGVPSASAAFSFLPLSQPSDCLQGAAAEPAWPASCWGAGYGLDETGEPDVCSQGPVDGRRLSRTCDRETRGKQTGSATRSPHCWFFFLSNCIKLGIALCSLCTMFRWCPESTRSHPILQIKETEASAFPESRQLINNGTGIRTKCKILGRGARRPGFESWLCQSPAVCPWHFAPSVVCDKTGVMTAPVPWGVL